MISLGLRRKELQEFHKLLASPHVLTNSIYVLDLEERYLRIIRNRLLEGQVNIDADAEVTRSCTMSLLDPEAQLNFDTQSPNAGALFMDRMIYVVQTFSEPPVHRTKLPEAYNYNKNPSLESAIGGAAGSNNGTLYTFAYDTGIKYVGTQSASTTRTTSSPSSTLSSVRLTPSSFANSLQQPAIGGEVWSHAVRTRANVTCEARIQVQWRDSANVVVRNDFSEYQTVYAGNWTRLLYENTVAPAGTSFYTIVVSARTLDGSNSVGGEKVNCDQVTATFGPVIGPYGDGDMVDWVWQGTPHGSESMRPAQWDMPEPKSYDVPIFRGPITKLDRSGDIINLEAQGKETLTLGWMWKSWTYRKGWQKAAIIINLLWFGTGERRFHIKKKSARIGKRYSIGRELIPWKACKKLANSINKQLYYDARGWCKLRRIPSKSVFTFRSGRGGTLKSIPQAGYDLSTLKNVVWVKGRKPKAPGNKDKKDNKNQRKRRRPNYIATAGRSHPLSPYKLGRNGVGLRFVEEIEDDSIRSQAEARRFAKRRLRQLLLEHLEVQFDSLPVPHLEPLDVCRVQTDDFAATFRLRKMSIPLTADASSTIGYTKRLRPNRARIRKRRR